MKTTRPAYEPVTRVFPGRVFRLFLYAITLLAAMHILMGLATNVVGEDSVPGIEYIAGSFDLNQEENIPTWVSSFMLLLCSAMLLVISSMEKREGHRFWVHWAVLSAIFALLSMDEVAQVHEGLNGVMELLGFVQMPSFLYGGWVVPATIFVVIVGLAYLKFLVHLSRSTRRLFVTAAVVYISGAVGWEMVTGFYLGSHGPSPSTISYILLVTLEEGAEMLGTAIFAYALLLHIGSYGEDLRFRVTEGSSVRNPNHGG